MCIKRKLLIMLLACSLHLISYNAFALSNFGWSMPVSYDMSTNTVPSSYMANVYDDNCGYVEDPTDSTNTVLAMKTFTLSSGTNTGVDIRAAVNNNDKVVQCSFDIYRTNFSGVFQMEVKPTDNAGYGSQGKPIFYLNNNGSLSTSASSTPYGSFKANTWYTFKLLLNKTHTSVSFYYKLRGATDYTFLNTFDLSNMDFDGHAIMFYFKNNSLAGFTYLDNLSFKEIGDVQFDFDDDIKDVSVKPTLTASLFNDIDEDASSISAVFTDEYSNTIDGDITLSDNVINITPHQTLTADTYYTLKLNVDLINTDGTESVNVYDARFLTVMPIGVVSCTKGSSNVTFKLVSNDDLAHDYQSMCIAYDKTTGERLVTGSAKGTVKSTSTEANPTSGSCTISVSNLSNYILECYIWSGVNTMKPMCKPVRFEQ